MVETADGEDYYIQKSERSNWNRLSTCTNYFPSKETHLSVNKSRTLL